MSNQCESDGCEREADYLIFYPGIAVKQCYEHREQAAAIEDAAGRRLSWARIEVEKNTDKLL